MDRKQKVVVFQQNGSGEKKIRAIAQYAPDAIDLEVIDIGAALPPVIDDPENLLPETIAADLVLDYLKHPDLADELARRCSAADIPMVSSAKKHRHKGVFTPPTCCGLPRSDRLGAYGERFGAPHLEAVVENGRVTDIRVIRGAPCGATWEAARKVIGLPVDTAPTRIGLETQFFCVADPAGWDPIYGKSPVHFAGDVHGAALERAIGGGDSNQHEKD